MAIRRWAASATAAVLLTGGAALATAPGASAADVSSIKFDTITLATSPGAEFPTAPAVTVMSGDQPAVGEAVTFTVIDDPVSGATVSLDHTTVQTDADGRAQVAVTAGSVGGFVYLKATAGTEQDVAFLVVRPSGYRPGEALASVIGEDQNGVTLDIRDTLKGNTFTLVDVCASWCYPCAYMAKNIEKAREVLATRYHIRLELTTLLPLGDSGPAVRDDAIDWAQRNGLTGSVLHANGSYRSDVYRAADFFVRDNGDQGGFPTHLLVDGKGMILDRVVGATEAEAVVERVLEAAGQRAHAKPDLPSKPLKGPIIGTVSVSFSGQSVSESFQDPADTWHSTPFVAVTLTPDFSDPAVDKFDFGFQTMGLPLPSDGPVTWTLTRYREQIHEPLTSEQLPVLIYSYLPSKDAWIVAETSPMLSATKSAGTVSVSADFSDLGSALGTELTSGDFLVWNYDAGQWEDGSVLGPLSDDLIAEALGNLQAVEARAEYANG